MSHSLIRHQRAPTSFEDCRTPCGRSSLRKGTGSGRSTWWCATFSACRAGEKEFVTLAGKPQWKFNRKFHEEYCGHVIRWFKTHGAVTAARFDEQSVQMPQPIMLGRINQGHSPSGSDVVP